jgi:fucose 4-O-acetylase-like acetyltransferase
MSRTTEQDRLVWIDQAKAIGIVLVVFGHVMTGVRTAGIAIDEQIFQVTWASIYSFHIPLFFFLSGLLFPRSLQHRGPWSLMLSKVDTVVYPYVLWSLLQGFLQVALSQHVNHPTTVGEVLSLLWQPRQEFWFLYALFFVYLIACVLYALVPAPYRWLLLAGSIGLYAARTDIPHVAALWYPAWYLVYCLAGALLPTTTKWVVARPAAALAVSVVVFVGAIFTLMHWGGTQSDPLVTLANLFAASSGTVATLAISAYLARADFRAGAYLGRRSLEVYLLHTTAAGFTRIALQKVLGVHDLSVHLIVGTLVGVGAPLAVAYLVECWGIAGVFSAPRSLSASPGGKSPATLGAR